MSWVRSQSPGSDRPGLWGFPADLGEWEDGTEAEEQVKVLRQKGCKREGWAGRQKLSWWEGAFGQISSFL